MEELFLFIAELIKRMSSSSYAEQSLHTLIATGRVYIILEPAAHSSQKTNVSFLYLMCSVFITILWTYLCASHKSYTLHNILGLWPMFIHVISNYFNHFTFYKLIAPEIKVQEKKSRESKNAAHQTLHSA